MFKFGKSSLAKKKTIHCELEAILEMAILRSMIDFGISEGRRSLARQKELYDQGLSKIDGIKKKGKHNMNPSMAVDIYAFVNGKASYELHDMCYLAGVITGVASALYNKGIITHKVRWGGNWDMDGVIIKDQTFQDLCHFELVK